MHFVESLLGFSPDGGSGATEIVFLTVVIFISARLFAAKRPQFKIY